MLTKSQEVELSARRDTVADLIRYRTWSLVTSLAVGLVSAAAAITVGVLILRR